MKSKRIQPLLGTLGLISVVFTASQLHAAPLYKVNDSDNLNLTSSWTTISGLINPPGSVGASDALYFNEVNMQGDKTLALGGNLAVGQYINVREGNTYLPHNRMFNTILSAAGVRKGDGSLVDDFGDESLPRGLLDAMVDPSGPAWS